MTVTVAPETFRFVKFDSVVVTRVAEELTAMLDMQQPLHIEIDETTPLGRMRATFSAGVGDTITVHVESGAFEDSKRPREQSEVATAINLGRILLRVRDRLHGGFGEAPADDDLALRQMAAWETYCAGRLSRLGLEVHQQRWVYNFRNRHGFTDTADAAFAQIWSADALTWGELEAISSAAAS
ncbi:MAG TPA: hypothetical protein PK020_18395 [Ilumatobacteraceae bacterium]|nr:hypothetical protein [Ilumatobacteraceae bacterium]HRB05068.1 hypothetical protein [Ilumatobacteraceae bacterium]